MWTFLCKNDTGIIEHLSFFFFFFKISINIYILFCHSLIYLFTFFFFSSIIWMFSGCLFSSETPFFLQGGWEEGEERQGVELLEELVDFHVGQCGFWNAACLQLRVFILGLDQSHFAWFLVPNNLYLLPTGWLFLLRKRSEQQMGVRLVCLRWPD